MSEQAPTTQSSGDEGAGLPRVFARTADCLTWDRLASLATRGDPYPDALRAHVEACAHCASMIKAANRVYAERPLWALVETRPAAVIVFTATRRVWPPPTAVLRPAAGTTGVVWQRRIALPPLEVPEHDLRIELEVFPLGAPRREATGQPSPVPDSVELHVTATTLSGEPLENLLLTVRLGDTPVVAGPTDDEGAIASDVFPGDQLLLETLTIEVHHAAGGAG